MRTKRAILIPALAVMGIVCVWTHAWVPALVLAGVFCPVMFMDLQES